MCLLLEPIKDWASLYSKDNHSTLNEKLEKLPRGRFSALFFSKRGSQLQLHSSEMRRPQVWQAVGPTSRHLHPFT